MGCLDQAFWTWFNHVTHLTDGRVHRNMEDFFSRQELTKKVVLGALARQNFAAPTRLKKLVFSFREHCLDKWSCFHLTSMSFSVVSESRGEKMLVSLMVKEGKKHFNARLDSNKNYCWSNMFLFLFCLNGQRTEDIHSLHEKILMTVTKTLLQISFL